MKHQRNYFLQKLIGAALLLAMLATGCKRNAEPMSEWESKMAGLLRADEVHLSHFSRSSSTDGGEVFVSNFLQLDIRNSEVLDKISSNRRLFESKCDEVRDSVLSFSALNEFPEFNQVKLRLIRIKEFAIFKSEKENVVTYAVN